MTATLTSSSEFSFAPRYSKLVDLIAGGITASPSFSFSTALASGIAAGQGNLMVLDQRTLTAGSEEDLNLTSGALLDVFGDPAVFVLMKYIFARVSLGNGPLRMGHPTANAFLGPLSANNDAVFTKLTAMPLFFFDPDGWTVTPATGNLLHFKNTGISTITYDLCLIGTDA